jgi:NAD(P)-dependent dehydrogenase (short-subunit alcohol dehydrogenase family)
MFRLRRPLALAAATCASASVVGALSVSAGRPAALASAAPSASPRCAIIVGAGSKHDRDGMGGDDLPPSTRFGLGGALALRFAKEDYTVILMGRRKAVLEEVKAEVEREGGRAVAVVCDVTSDESVAAAFKQAKSVGECEVLVFNPSPPLPPGRDFLSLPKPHEVSEDYLQHGFNVGVTGCIRCVKQVIEPMLEKGSGTILVSGATMGLRGGPSFACMSPVKFALRSLSQSMFNAYAPQGVHVANVVIDGVIDSPNMHAWGEKMMLQDPAELAEAFVMLVNQPKTCWSYELMVSPCKQGVGMRM